MRAEYVIMVKGLKDVNGEPKEIMCFAAIDNGSYGSGMPCWSWSDHGCQRFPSVQKAVEWFNANKQYLFGQYYNPIDFNMESLSVRKMKYVQEKKLHL